MFDSQIDLGMIIDFCDSAFIFVDNDFTINYINFKALKIFQNYEQSWKNYIPEFKSYNLIDYKFDFLATVVEPRYEEYKNIQLGDSMKIDLNLGQLIFTLKITPIFDKSAHRIGSCIEMSDITSIIEATKNFNLAIQAAHSGDFSHRINTETLEQDSHFKGMLSQVNGLFAKLDHFVGDIAYALESLANGNLTYVCDVEKGKSKSYYCLVKQDINYTFEKLNHFVINIQHNSQAMENSINYILSENSELAMTIENEYIQTTNFEKHLDESISLLQHNNTELCQATHVNAINDSNELAMNQLKSTLYNVGEQINNIGHIAQTLDNIFSIHVTSLKSGIEQMDQGNFGRGLAIISEQCHEIINKSSYAMTAIKEAIRTMTQSFSCSSDSIGDVINAVSNNMFQMKSRIDIFSQTMEVIQDSLNNQTKTYNDVRDFIKQMQELRLGTLKTIEHMIVSVSTLVNINYDLKSSVQAFSTNTILYDYKISNKNIYINAEESNITPVINLFDVDKNIQSINELSLDGFKLF